jgi:hypothetical protein
MGKRSLSLILKLSEAPSTRYHFKNYIFLSALCNVETKITKSFLISWFYQKKKELKLNISSLVISKDKESRKAT